MNAKEFFDLVADMRKAQKEYFRTRDKEVLIKSKDLENRVDVEIARVRTIINTIMSKEDKRDDKPKYPRGC